MKSKAKSKILILVILGILFALLPMIAVNLSFFSEYSDDSNLDNKILKISAVSEKIEISYNSGWVAFRSAGNCTGSGTYSDPYIIEDLEIDGGASGICISITSSDVYFKIQNCTLYNSAVVLSEGIRFINVRNSQLINNNCSTNYMGFYLWGCDNNTIVGNTANNVTFTDGIYLRDCDYNTISGNSFSYNYDSGINLYISNYLIANINYSKFTFNFFIL